MTLQQEDVACREVADLLTAYMDDALTAGERERLDRHLELCPPCTQYLDQMRLTISAVGQVTPDDLSPSVVDDLVSIFRDWREQDAPSPSS